MSTLGIVLLVIGIGIVVIAAYLISQYVAIYNKFQYWYHKAQRKFADILPVLQQRLDELYAFAQDVKKYDIHEHKFFKDVAEARSRWSKDVDFNEKAKIMSQVESNFLKIQTVLERYPHSKAISMHWRLGKRISRIESRLREARKEYNYVVQQYNERVNRFPRNIVAMIHGFKELNYLDFSGQPTYEAKKIFNDE